MKRGWLVLIVALFATISVVNADVQSKLLTDKPPTEKQLRRGFAGVTTLQSRSYRSPGALHKVMVAATDDDAIARLQQQGARELTDYGSFKLFLLHQPNADRQQLSLEEALASDGELPPSIQIRDDLNLLLLRSGIIDTTSEGNLLPFDKSKFEAATVGSDLQFKGAGSRLRLLQFSGPVKQAWLEQLQATGVEIIAYVPSNGYLVREDAASSGRLAKAIGEAQARDEAFVQWVGDFKDEYKIDPALTSAIHEGGDVTVAVQFARNRDGSSADDTRRVRKLAASLIVDAYPVLNFTTVKMRVDASRLTEIAALPNVVNIESWTEPRLFDERAGLIVASQFKSDGKELNAPGYMSWLQSKGLGGRFNFAIDVTDTGVDRGLLEAANLHPDFRDTAGQSRMVYARDYTSELDPSDVPGHGTINLSIAGGYNVSSANEARDSGGFSYGLGIAPLVSLGSSKIFQSNGRFGLNEPYTNLISAAYKDGARISSNSWGAASNAYTIDSQEYDSRVRDAVPSQAGNQEIVICFAAGNSGSGRRIGDPSTAKNVLSVGASEGIRKAGTDGCLTTDADADNAFDMAIFSSGGPLEDGRLKPDLVAPGTHIQGAASQSPDFDGSGVCGSDDLEIPHFPKGQTLYTWSSGTSHSTPIIAGAAALVRQHFLNRGEEPSAALVKAMLVNTTTYITGELAKGDLPHPRQGWGLLNLNRLFDNTPKILINQSQTFTDSGQEFVLTGEVKDSSQPFRITLAWSDAPGFSAFAPWVNNLDLEVIINGQIYRGNNFEGDKSKVGGDTDTKNNVESVWLPAGTTGTFAVRIRAANIAGDGIPNSGDASDQDFALVVYNGERKDLPVVTFDSVVATGGSDATIDPGESASLKVRLRDISPTALSGATGTLTTTTTGVTVTMATADFATIAPNTTGENSSPFVISVARTVACGSTIQFTLNLNAQGSTSSIPFAVNVGNFQALELFTDNIEAGDAKWSHASAFKKKKKKVPVDPWAISNKRFRSGGKAWFAANSGVASDAHLDSVAISLPTDAKNLQLVFYHTFEFEGGSYDGGVLEISVNGGDFEDLGTKILTGGYTGKLARTTTNPLSERDGWIDGTLGVFQQVVVDLSSYAGKSVVIRFRIGTDSNVSAAGWYIDDVLLRADRVTCAPPPEIE